MGRELKTNALIALLWIAGWLVSGSAAVTQTPARCEVPVELSLSRPLADEGPTEVRVGTYLLDLRSIDDSQQSFEADIVLGLVWRDPRLVAGEVGAALRGCTLGLDEVWNPRVVLVNERQVSRLLEDQVAVDEDGLVTYQQRLQGTFTTLLQLQDFPFDRHVLRLEMIARGQTPEEIAFVVDRSRTGAEERLTIPDWRVEGSDANVSPRRVSVREEELARVLLELHVKRDLRFYMMKVFTPLTLIIFMSWAVFWIKPGLLPPQIGVSTSAVLTLIAFQFSLGYMLPRLSYLTRADRFLMGSTLLVFLAFGEAIWTSYLATGGREERALAIDRIARWLFPLGFVIVVTISFVW